MEAAWQRVASRRHSRHEFVLAQKGTLMVSSTVAEMFADCQGNLPPVDLNLIAAGSVDGPAEKAEVPSPVGLHRDSRQQCLRDAVGPQLISECVE